MVYTLGLALFTYVLLSSDYLVYWLIFDSWITITKLSQTQSPSMGESQGQNILTQIFQNAHQWHANIKWLSWNEGHLTFPHG